MPADALIRLAAGLGLGLGLALLYLRWRGPKAAGRGGLVLGWGGIALALGGWIASGHGDVALSDGVSLFMILALVVIAGHALTLAPAARTARMRVRSADDGLSLGPGYWNRATARLVGCVLAAPAAGLMLGALWRAWIPGEAADRLMMMATIAVLGTAGAWVLQLASPRPWRILGILTAIALAGAAAAFLPGGGRA